MAILPSYETSWDYMSDQHERLDEEVQQVLDDYVAGSVEDWAYAVVGTYGVGKTQFLYHVHRQAIERGIVPLYILAEDLFREIISKDRKATPGDVYKSVEKSLSLVRESLSKNDSSRVKDAVDPRGKLQQDCPELVSEVIERFSGEKPEKVVLLVDELEGQYGTLQERVETKDRSPLREWLESTSHLKFLAFAPAGIYELGGADASRVQRRAIHAAGIDFIREKLIEDAGRSNACWWLSRGKARQLLKTAQALERLDGEQAQDAAQVSRFIMTELDRIGQAPTEVPPAVLDEVPPSRIPFLLDLAPKPGESRRRYVIDTKALATGELAEELVKAFGTNRDNALALSYYLKKTASALSNAEWRIYLEDDELPELFCLALDHLLEYEHGNPELSDAFGEILALYERSREEPAAIYGTVARLFELRDTRHQLPLRIEDIRRAFPFPTMNPIVKDYVPDQMLERWEGQGLPLWRWARGDATILFFASWRDYLSYSETDEFLSSALPEGRSIICLIPRVEGSEEQARKPILRWLEENRKLAFVSLQHLLSDFLLSASGELKGSLPGDLEGVLRDFRSNKDDVLLSRKTDIYDRALKDTVEDELLRPTRFCKGEPPHADNVWGSSQMGYRAIAVRGIALAFSELRPEERQLLVRVRELFRGGKGGRGVGDLHYLISGRAAPGKGGHTRLPERLLPYDDAGGGTTNTEVIEALSLYWREDDRRSLEKLARIVALEKFLKLHSDENVKRMLEALWRSSRQEFEAENLDDLTRQLEAEIIPVLEDCRRLENLADQYDVSGIYFQEGEQLVKSLPGFEELLDVLKASREATPIVQSLAITLASTIDEHTGTLRSLSQISHKAKRAMDELGKSAEALKRNFWEYERAARFVGLEEDALRQVVQQQVKMTGRFEADELEAQATRRRNVLDDMSASLAELESKLRQIEGLFEKIMEVE